MPGIVEEGIHGEESVNGVINGVISKQIVDQLYDSISRHSVGTEGSESQIDSELHCLVNGKMREVEIMEEDEDTQKYDSYSDSDFDRECSSIEMPITFPSGSATASSPSKRTRADVGSKKYGSSRASNHKLHSDDLELGHFLLKQAKDVLSSGDDAQKALDLATRAAESFEKCAADGTSSFDLVISLHVIAASYCSLGLYNEAVPVLNRSIKIALSEEGLDELLAGFAGFMQLGDVYMILGLFKKSSSCYINGLEFQKRVLGESDPRIGETCRYLARAHIQAMQFDEVQKFGQISPDLHNLLSPDSLKEAADRRLMGMIFELKGDHEAALETLTLARIAFVANGLEKEVASIDCSIGDSYLSVNKYDEAIAAYLKALKSLERDNHNHLVPTVFVRLADLYNKTGNSIDSRSYCEKALQIYAKSNIGIAPEEKASGFASISSIYESLDESELALEFLQKALEIYNQSSSHQTIIAAIEAQMGIIYYRLEKYSESYISLKNATQMMSPSGEKMTAFYGISLNQMGLTCVQLGQIIEATKLFEESKCIFEREYGPCHRDTLGVCSNLAGAYDVLGRVDEAIELLEVIVRSGEDVNDEKNKLADMLKEMGRSSRILDE